MNFIWVVEVAVPNPRGWDPHMAALTRSTAAVQMLAASIQDGTRKYRVTKYIAQEKVK